MTDRMVALRFASGDFENIRKFSEKIGYDTVSAFIRDAVSEMVKSGNVSQVAGKNFIQYNSLEDKFIWKIITDMGEESVVAENIDSDFLKQLKEEIELKLKEREQLMKKKKKDSVPVSRSFV